MVARARDEGAIPEALPDDIEEWRRSVEQAGARVRNDLMTALREIRGELAEIRTRLDSLVAIEKQLSYHGGRLTAIENRLTALVEMKVNPPVPPTAFQSSPGPAG